MILNRYTLAAVAVLFATFTVVVIVGDMLAGTTGVVVGELVYLAVLLGICARVFR